MKSRQSIPTNTTGSRAGGVRLDGNLTSDFLVADMSNCAHTWDLDKGENGGGETQDGEDNDGLPGSHISQDTEGQTGR